MGQAALDKKMLEVLQRIGCKVILFVQSLKSDVKEYKGISIISAEEYFKGNYDCYIFYCHQQFRCGGQYI